MARQKNPTSIKPKAPKADPASDATMNNPDGQSTPAPPRNLAEAVMRVQIAVPYIRKRGSMGSKYKFVRDTDVVSMLKPAMIENGLVLLGPTGVKNTTRDDIKTGGGSNMFRTCSEMTFDLVFAPTGETKRIETIGEGADNLDKSSNKCMSAARKYALMFAFNLASGDDPDSFDEEGNHVDDEHDEHDRASKPTKAAQPAPQKTAEPTKPKNKDDNTPENGKELHDRLAAYDQKLANEKRIVRGALLAHVVAAGVKAGYTADMTQWTGPAIPFAVACVKEFVSEVEAHERKAEANRDAEAKALADKAKQEASAAELAKAAEPAKETPGPGANGSTKVKLPDEIKTPEDVAALVAERVRRMGITDSIEKLNKFREIYTQDKRLSKEQIKELETVYWNNNKRLTQASAKA